MARMTELEKVMADLSHKTRVALGTIVGENSTIFVTPADVAERILSNHNTLSEDERNEVIKRVGGLLAQMYRQGTCNIFRTEHKITPKAVNRKAQYGYRIGPSLVPLRTMDVRREEALSSEAVAAAINDPVEFLLSIKGQLPLLKLNALLVEITQEIQNRVLSNHVAMSDLEKRIKALSDDFKGLTGEAGLEEDPPMQEEADPQQGKKKKKGA